MAKLSVLLRLTLGTTLACAAACSHSHGHSPGDSDLGDDGGFDFAAPIPGDGGNGNADLAPGMLDVEPSTLQTITVTSGQTMPPVAYTATVDGLPVNAAWSVDRGDIASLPSSTGSMVSFTPRGTNGGLVTLTAGFNGQDVSRQVMVKIVGTQNGYNAGNPAEASQLAPDTASLTAGGGVGGVGGEGLGGNVTDPATLTALTTPTTNGSGVHLKYLYPYDKTLWPRGILAPLLMWSWDTNDADAIQISIKTTSGSFSYTGTFGRPAILATTMGPFIRMPIPEDVWQQATESAGGVDQLTVSLTIAKAGVGYGPISETWSVAAARLDGIIYYNSYGTQLAQNFTGAVGGNGKFGGAVLSIHVGDTAPQLAAGASGTAAQCRVCHSVAASGSKLIVQQGSPSSYPTSSEYDIATTGLTENVLTHTATFSGIYPDGSKTLTQAGQLLPLDVDTTAITTTGLTTVSTQLGTPGFSPDGKLVAFNPQEGGNGGGQKLMVMSFDGTSAFTNLLTVVDDTALASQVRPAWPSFLPDSKSLVFGQQTQVGIDGNSGGQFVTRKFEKQQVEWTSSTDATHVTVLNQLNGLDANGVSYLPQLAAPSTLQCCADNYNVAAGSPACVSHTYAGTATPDLSHEDDANMNYEPTVNPIGSGGYAWVVFTSRRMYGSEATIPPYCSDPRGVDLINNITTKKLWVAAIDLNAAPGTDASHPAFYLPAQELLAGNSRAFWVLDPCRADGTSCDSGDECCNGYCEADGDGGLICSNTLPNGQCSPVGSKCTTAPDCCDPTNQCINGFCTVANPPIQ